MLTLQMRRLFDAPPSAVYDAWTQPARLQNWIWGSLGHQVQAAADVRIGGEYRVSTQRPDGAAWTMSGKYLELIPPRRLRGTLVWDAPVGYQAPAEEFTVDLETAGEGTEMRFIHAGIPSREAVIGHEKGWDNAFQMLEQILHGCQTP
jgi:uncharacterized protein YndB with AHSA1/START domain